MLDALKANTAGEWSEGPNGIICNRHEQDGGIIDRAIISNEWFIVFNRDGLDTLHGFPTRDSAISRFLNEIGINISVASL
ncbi:hypothetical protein [Pseudogemmobacter faecipullorum]|uniref:Uncharacterized protein n=1 Tax=Pseudogemmobacter faecipullorum TaxID=2755041 RepID=A0ABS8CRT0_9RHOB|nr:hypothetical protein [Pseudogemmobacter faecipullorum]MCB5412099.1 hypothetical protein [Pseudogemmobacter faecipullorum]